MTLSFKEKLPSLSSIKNLDRKSIIQAPKGTLTHHYHLNKSNFVDRINFFVATELNIPLISQMIMKYTQELFEITDDINLMKKNIRLIIRAFNPCISCATHYISYI